MTWLRQSFWDFLDWEEVVQYIALCIAHGPAMCGGFDIFHLTLLYAAAVL